MRFVDLFAGCGGLSLGMERAGGELICAVEKSDMAARTFYHNHVGDAADIRRWESYVRTDLARQVAHRVVVRPLSDVLEDSRIMGALRQREIDAVVGGPPCQGFSMAGRRQRDDIRNRLAWEYLDFVERTSPKMVVIENVVGMRNTFTAGEESSFDQLRDALATRGRQGYLVQPVQVNAMHYGSPQHRPRLMLIAVRSDIAGLLGISVTNSIWKSAFRDELAADVPDLAPIPVVRSADVWTVRDSISDLGDWGLMPGRGRNARYLERLRWLSEALDRPVPSSDQIQNQNKRRHTDRVATRFSVYRWMQQNGIDARMFSLLDRGPGTAGEVARSFLGDIEYPVVLRASANDVGLRFESETELTNFIVGLGTRKHSQKALDPDKPARTVVSLPDDYVHPAESRTFTVRELARFQGFPDNFEFLGKETTGAHRRRVEVPQYTQVGNAVSPWQSYAVALRLKEHLDRYRNLIQEERVLEAVGAAAIVTS
ncbi:DNA cytosine methyltransferase [Sinomonas flava]|uniref:DNA cytosine methyltransferase n=1 Tax=Sinomonas flava TaxID=496857 RepID=UPI0039A69F3E